MTSKNIATAALSMLVSLLCWCCLCDGHSPLLFSASWPDPSTPPVWPNSFQVKFREILQVGFLSIDANNGTWYYNFNNRTARFDHGKGQRNNFCQGQGLSPQDHTAECHLLFTASGDMWVIYPGAGDCCRLCGTQEGCTVLKPDWLTGASLIETINIEGRDCAGWAKKGAVAPADTWYEDNQGVPCRYHEVVGDSPVHILHNLTFSADSYSAGPVDPAVFEVPSYCQKKCPHPYPQPHP